MDAGSLSGTASHAQCPRTSESPVKAVSEPSGPRINAVDRVRAEQRYVVMANVAFGNRRAAAQRPAAPIRAQPVRSQRHGVQRHMPQGQECCVARRRGQCDGQLHTVALLHGPQRVPQQQPPVHLAGLRSLPAAELLCPGPGLCAGPLRGAWQHGRAGAQQPVWCALRRAPQEWLGHYGTADAAYASQQYHIATANTVQAD